LIERACAGFAPHNEVRAWIEEFFLVDPGFAGTSIPNQTSQTEE
jgi:hypothetical protein